MHRTLKDVQTVRGFYRKKGTAFQKMKKDAGNQKSRKKNPRGALKTWMEETGHCDQNLPLVVRLIF